MLCVENCSLFCAEQRCFDRCEYTCIDPSKCLTLTHPQYLLIAAYDWVAASMRMPWCFTIFSNPCIIAQTSKGASNTPLTRKRMSTRLSSELQFYERWTTSMVFLLFSDGFSQLKNNRKCKQALFRAKFNAIQLYFHLIYQLLIKLQRKITVKRIFLRWSCRWMWFRRVKLIPFPWQVSIQLNYDLTLSSKYITTCEWNCSNWESMAMCCILRRSQ